VKPPGVGGGKLPLPSRSPNPQPNPPSPGVPGANQPQQQPQARPPGASAFGPGPGAGQPGPGPPGCLRQGRLWCTGGLQGRGAGGKAGGSPGGASPSPPHAPLPLRPPGGNGTGSGTGSTGGPVQGVPGRADAKGSQGEVSQGERGCRCVECRRFWPPRPAFRRAHERPRSHYARPGHRSHHPGFESELKGEPVPPLCVPWGPGAHPGRTGVHAPCVLRPAAGPSPAGRVYPPNQPQHCSSSTCSTHRCASRTSSSTWALAPSRSLFVGPVFVVLGTWACLDAPVPSCWVLPAYVSVALCSRGTFPNSSRTRCSLSSTGMCAVLKICVLCVLKNVKKSVTIL